MTKLRCRGADGSKMAEAVSRTAESVLPERHNAHRNLVVAADLFLL